MRHWNFWKCSIRPLRHDSLTQDSTDHDFLAFHLVAGLSRPKRRFTVRQGEQTVNHSFFRTFTQVQCSKLYLFSYTLGLAPEEENKINKDFPTSPNSPFQCQIRVNSSNRRPQKGHNLPAEEKETFYIIILIQRRTRMKKIIKYVWNLIQNPIEKVTQRHYTRLVER